MPVNRSTQTAQEKRAELVLAARRMFLERGYDATSMSRIAQSAQVTPNTIYWYFKDKDELLIAVLADVMQEDMAAYVQEAEGASPVDQLVLAGPALESGQQADFNRAQPHAGIERGQGMARSLSCDF